VQTLVLGTANFGGSYGIANKTKLSSEEIDEILVWASERISELDTSSDYEGSHDVISKHSSNFKITSKINLNQIASLNEICKSVNQISVDLCTDKIDKILLRPHSSSIEFTIECLRELERLASMGVINEFGLSIYEREELEYFAKYTKSPMVFQVPLNLFNRSFQELLDAQETRFKRFKFYVRSIFLQGLLLLNPSDIPRQLTEAIPPLESLNRELSRIGSSAIEATLSFIRERSWVDGVIIGVNSLDELKKNFEVFIQSKTIDCSFIEKLPHVPSMIQDPRRW